VALDEIGIVELIEFNDVIELQIPTDSSFMAFAFSLEIEVNHHLIP